MGKRCTQFEKIYERMAEKWQGDKMIRKAEHSTGPDCKVGGKAASWEGEGGRCFSGHSKGRLKRKERFGLQKRGMLAWKHRVQYHTAPKRWN